MLLFMLNRDDTVCTRGTGFVPVDVIARLGSESDAGDEASEFMQT